LKELHPVFYLFCEDCLADALEEADDETLYAAIRCFTFFWLNLTSLGDGFAVGLSWYVGSAVGSIFSKVGLAVGYF